MLEPKTFTLTSGKELVVNISGFGLCIRLSNAIIRCFANQDIKLDASIVERFANNEILESPDFVTAFVKAVLDVFTDPSVNAVFWEMAKKCTWDKLKINEDLFNNQAEARQDFYQMQFIILRENILPFFPTLRTTLADLSK